MAERKFKFKEGDLIGFKYSGKNMSGRKDEGTYTGNENKLRQLRKQLVKKGYKVGAVRKVTW